MKPSLESGPAKIAVRVKEGNTIKVLAVEPKTYEYLTSNDTELSEVKEKCMYSKPINCIFISLCPNAFK